LESRWINCMRRRDFIIWLGSSAVVLPPAAAFGQPANRPRRIAVLMGAAESDPETISRMAVFTATLRQLGWTDGDNLRIVLRSYQGKLDRATQYAKEMVEHSPDLIIANGTVGIEAARSTTHNIPIVFALVGNPVGTGIVASMSRPGGNITGFSAFEPEIVGKWMQALKEIAPATRHVTVLFYPGYDFLWHGAEAAATPLGLDVVKVTCRDVSAIERAISALSDRPDSAITVLPTPLFAFNRALIVRWAATHRVPAVYPFRYFVQAGGLMSYGLDGVDIFRRAAQYVDRILKGEQPGDLPVQAPTKFDLAINLKTAKALGLTVPLSLLGRADHVIE
jgi:putative ABC transport system substrate-binding protein